ncbi:diguanylate cyclase [Cryobacterium sp. MDB1-18-2]|uniref:sensor domain-containing diguanylate cyclase n=1 Tax=unclassified Cryobacterium TaxID=2649013 RepID=UPI00106D060D|nr:MULTISPECIES: sensor domain-containing diguanylate cyclase [unclassified Cryobacterium]MEB0288240.1 sensor domain-containing diguanylate cyclase [Cryobacterium sp. 10S3]MEB0306673.1 sensor domain-containing diguanylate cyclase [Cryobacterium sp. 10I1]TFC35981.1 diguanylate cyclase [Cryobacterium sp. MDB1-18-2]TFC41601.1 diguanylate cyclase [Cryobacterium sp. MDB1-18-1]WPX12954.1 sensor domain-containing diguanylate cyclase [Cryobacterium sp. 10S3]
MDDYEALVAERDLLRTAIDRIPALIGHWNNDLRCDLANTAYGMLLGGDAAAMRGRHISEVLGAELYASNFPMVRGALDGIPQHFDRTLVDAGGVTRHLQVDYQPDIAGGFFVQVADVSERMAAQQRLGEVLEFQNAVLETTPDLITVFDLDEEKLLWASKSLSETYGYSVEGLSDPAERDRAVPSEDRGIYRAAQERVRLALDHEVVHCRHRMVTADGRSLWVERGLTPFKRNVEGRVTQYLSVSRDITGLVHAERQLDRAANHDDLTGLANRRQFISALEEAVGRESGEVALVYCDLDDFKSINDRHGHAVGDTVLCLVAERLGAVVRPSDLVARLGGDEFVILITGGIPEASALVERITERMRPVFPIGDLTLAVRASIGVAIGAPGASAEDLFARADADMYRMKPGTPRRALRARVRRAAVGRR